MMLGEMTSFLMKEELRAMGHIPTRDEYDRMHAKWSATLNEMQADPKFHWLRPRYRELYMHMWAELIISHNPHHASATKTLELFEDEEDSDQGPRATIEPDVAGQAAVHEDLPPTGGER
jgi:hypothetical protein